MIIIKDPITFKNTLNNISNDKKIGIFSVMGPLHGGHHSVLKKAKNDLDIIIINYIEYLSYIYFYLQGYKYKKQYTINSIIESAYKSNIADYLYIESLIKDNDIMKKIHTCKDDFNRLYNECKKLGLNKNIACECMFLLLQENYKKNIIRILGAKYVIQPLIYHKVFNNNIDKFNSPLIEFYKDKNNDVITRSKSSSALNILRKDAIEALKAGILDESFFLQNINNYFSIDTSFAMIDLKSIKKITTVSDNCALIYMDNIGHEFIYIINGKLIY